MYETLLRPHEVNEVPALPSINIATEKLKQHESKREDKRAYRHSGHPGGLKTINVGDQLRTHPDRVIERAIKGMLPHNTLGRQMLSKLKVYAGPEHPHAAQQPQPFEIKQVAQ